MSFAKISRATSSGASARAVYVSRLRRAFLLRVHPDRFGEGKDESENSNVRRRQAELVQAMMSWLSSPAVLSYTSSVASPSYGLSWNDGRNKKSDEGLYEYYLEGKDDELVEHSIRLAEDEPVYDVLTHMSNVLRDHGVPMPPPPAPPSNPQHQQPQTRSFHEPHKANTRQTGVGINHRYDVKSKLGRNLLHFLQTQYQPQDVLKRQATRLDAMALSQLVRNAYGFQSIDVNSSASAQASSASFAATLRALLALHREHAHHLHLDTFYPITLHFGHDEFQHQLDFYQGTLRLHPGATPLQWLHTLKSITPHDLQLIQHYKAQLATNRKIVMQGMGWDHIQKGRNCPSEAYYSCLQHLACQIREEQQGPLLLETSSLLTSDISTQTTPLPSPSTPSPSSPQINNPNHTTNTVPHTIRGPLRIVLESPNQLCFHKSSSTPLLTHDGWVRLGSDVHLHHHTLSSLREMLALHEGKAREASLTYQQDQLHLQQQSAKLSNLLGLSRRGIRKSPTSPTLTLSQMNTCVERLVTLFQSEYDLEGIKSCLVGQTIHVASSGHHCEMGDDGSVIIPWDFLC